MHLWRSNFYILKKDWERTSLKPYVDMLEKHSMGLMEEVRRSKIEKIGEFARRLSILVFHTHGMRL